MWRRLAVLGRAAIDWTPWWFILLMFTASLCSLAWTVGMWIGLGASVGCE